MFYANMRPYLSSSADGRLLGIVRASDKNGAGYDWPAIVEREFSRNPEAVLTGDFRVCPYTRDVPHKMRLACIAEASLTDVKDSP